MREIKSTLLSLVAVLAMCVVGVSAQPESGAPCEEITFGAPTYSAAGLGPRGLTATDLNGDGNTDLVAANETSATVTIRFGDGNGNFPTSQQLAATGASSTAVADLNNDGNLDLVISHRSISAISVRLGLGGGAFGAPVQTSVGSGPSQVLAADFNHDGLLDLVTSNGGTNTISLLLGDGSGAFPLSTPYSISRGSGAWGVVAADFNDDGNLDLATPNRGTANISVVLGIEAGGFGPATVFAAGTQPSSITAADFNGDGKLDLATANEGSNTVTVRFNNGLGSFPTAVTLSSGALPFFVRSGDLDNDGDADLVVTNQGSNSLSVFKGSGTGTFAPAMDFAIEGSPRSLIVADLNDDEGLDIAAGTGASTIAVLLNGCVQNTAPTITSAMVTREQDAGSSNSSIATVADAEQNPDSLVVTVNGGASATVNGVTVSNISVDATGSVTADVNAACGASDATFTLEVRDSDDLSATATLEVDVTVETIPPVINDGAPLPDITVVLPASSPGTSMPVDFNLPTATDNCTASPAVTSSPASGSAFSLGITTVTVTATDDAGNASEATFKVKVMFDFGGFGPLVEGVPRTNLAIGGIWVPVPFSLNGNRGLNVIEPGYPKSSVVPCSQNVPGPILESTETPNNVGLIYHAPSNRYLYVWKTQRDYKRTCRIFVLKLTDGSEHYAKFWFL